MAHGESYSQAKMDLQTGSYLIELDENGDVEVSDLAHYLTIEKGSDVWTDMLFKEKFNRKNVTDKIKEKGFDICESTERLSVFYRGIINE